MKKSRFTETQIVALLHEHEAGKKVADLCREHGVSQPTFYQWEGQVQRSGRQPAQGVQGAEGEVRPP
ncbi:MAG: transposase [Flavobacteriales bacterium]|jgi:putative transposase|nr:transposase [Flavobacteriales bacterium]MBK7943177.1 transposase [Flavobacteriales bacterium]MBK8947321.1 transposase [Flavobacteriales bacterium]MBK9701772.1 transposase [Flavobacteriales bacterium]